MPINYPQRYDDDFINIIKKVIDHVNEHGKTIQDLVADGQLTPSQYAELLKNIHDLVGEEEYRQFKKDSTAVMEAIIKEYELIVNKERVQDIFTFEGSKNGTISETSGNVNAHDTNIVTDYIPINGNTEYSFYRHTAGLFKVVWFDANKNFISGIGWQETQTHHVFSSPSNARYVRIGLAVGSGVTVSNDDFTLNIGSTLYDENAHYQGFWDNIPRPTVGERSITGINVAEKTLSHEHVDFINESGNQLFDISKMTDNRSIDTDGNIVVETSRWLSDYIPFNENRRTISISPDPTSVIISVHDSDKNFRMLSGFKDTYTIHEAYTEAGEDTYFRISGTYRDYPPEEMMINYGDHALPYEDFTGPQIDSAYLPKTSNVYIDEIIAQLPSGSVKHPYPPKLELTEVYEGREQPMWLSKDGEVLYGAAGTQVLMSTDEWETQTQIGQDRLPMTTMGIRELNDGELLASATRNENLNIKAKLYKTRGFDRLNPGACTWEEVHTVNVTQANIRNDWSMEVYGDMVLVSEYGLRDLEGARYAYISQDHGETFTEIFDLVNEDIPGRPAWDEQAHIHTIAYDAYWNRIWLCVGDSSNTAVYYSDDFGEKWKFVPGSEQVQFTGIIAMENHVIFGTDGAPNGVYVYRRKDRATDPVIEPLLIINDSNTLTHVFGLPFRREMKKGVPVFFNAPVVPYPENNATMVVGLIDGYKAHILYEGEKIYNSNDGTGFTVALGETANGNIILSSKEPGRANAVTYKAPAPVWE